MRCITCLRSPLIPVHCPPQSCQRHGYRNPEFLPIYRLITVARSIRRQGSFTCFIRCLISFLICQNFCYLIAGFLPAVSRCIPVHRHKAILPLRHGCQIPLLRSFRLPDSHLVCQTDLYFKLLRLISKLSFHFFLNSQ